MYANAVESAKTNLVDLKAVIENPDLSISVENKKKIDSLCQSLEESIDKLSQLAKDNDNYKLQILADDVNLPKIRKEDNKIGGGAYGEVYKSTLGGSEVAVKLNKSEMDDKIKARQEFEKEIKILRLLRHDNIVAYRGSGFYGDEQFVVMELVEGNLHKFIHSRPTGDGSGLSAFLTWHIAKQVANALSFLHSKQIAHGDIKPDNILLDLTPVFPKPKLCDFGFSWHYFGDAPKDTGHVRYTSKVLGTRTFQEAVARDTFGFGLVVLESRTGQRPWGKLKTYELSSKGKLEEVQKPTESRRYWKIGDIRLAEVFSGDLGEIIVECCADINAEKNLDDVMPMFDKENPYKAKETEGEFFACGFLTNTNIYVVDSVVKEKNDPNSVLPTYRAEDLICDVMLKPKMENYRPEEKELQEKYDENYKKFKEMAKKKIIDDNPMLALKRIMTDRAGEEEAQKIKFTFVKSTYCHHRAMRDIWREFDEVEKNSKVKDKNSVNQLYSTSFGLHVAILTNEGDGKRKFVFTERSRRVGVATPGAFTCGAVESCSVKDFLKPPGPNDKKARVSLVETAARGLDEELGLVLSEEDRKAINLNTTYLKFDNHEWGMCGFVDLTDDRISRENQLSFQRLNAAFTSGPKDRFEHSKIYGVDFDLKAMVQWIREHHNNMASSGKIVVVKVLETYFGTAAVTKEFESYVGK